MVSVILIVKDEARQIARCLESVTWAEEIIVLDSGSRDQTVEICRRYTPHVYCTDWPGFGPQKQRALEYATQEWVLSLDADEYLSPALCQEIHQAICSPHYVGYQIPRLSTYCGREMRHGGWWPDPVLRLFRRDCARFSSDLVHERVVVTGAVARLHAPLQHEAFVDLEEVLAKVNHYSTLAAVSAYQRGVRSSLPKAVAKGWWSFVRTYLLRRGFLDGREGLMLALSNAEGSYYKYLKIAQLEGQSPGSAHSVQQTDSKDLFPSGVTAKKHHDLSGSVGDKGCDDRKTL